MAETGRKRFHFRDFVSLCGELILEITEMEMLQTDTKAELYRWSQQRFSLIVLI